MNNETVKGAIHDIEGKARRKIGEWTSNPKAEEKGVVLEKQGQAEKDLGKMNDVATEANDENHNIHVHEEVEHERRESERKHHEALGS